MEKNSSSSRTNRLQNFAKFWSEGVTLSQVYESLMVSHFVLKGKSSLSEYLNSAELPEGSKHRVCVRACVQYSK